MNMPIELSLYEALTEAGVKPDSARRVERQVEAAITRGQESVRAEMHSQLMTKADGLLLKNELKKDIAEVRADFNKAMNDQTWKLIVAIVAINGLTLAGFKLLG